jgi:hypothetical protein
LIGEAGGEHDPHEDRFAPGIKDEASENQNPFACRPRMAEEKIDDQQIGKNRNRNRGS